MQITHTQDAAAQAAGLRRSFLTPSSNRPCWVWRTGFCLGHAASYPWQSASASRQPLFPANHCAAGRGPTSKLQIALAAFLGLTLFSIFVLQQSHVFHRVGVDLRQVLQAPAMIAFVKVV